MRALTRRLQRLRDPVLEPPGVRGPLVGVERRRVRRAAVELVAERGSLEFEYDDLLLAASVSASPFFQGFGSLGDCLREALEELGASLGSGMLEAFLRERVWREGLRAAAYEALGRLEADPELGDFLLICLTSAQDFCRPTRREMTGLVTELIDAGSQDLEILAPRPHPVAAQTAACICAMVLAGLRGGGVPLATELVPQIMYVALVPYTGREVAESELDRGPRDVALHRQEHA